MDSACAEIIRLAEKVMDGGEITEEEAKKLIRTKDEDTMLLLAMADKIRQKFNGNAVDFCAIINARSGHCQENCKFCAQSGWYHTGAKVYRLLPEDEILEAAKKAKAAGAVRFSLVTSGRNQDNPNEFEEIIDIVKKIREQVGIEVCCSLGLITKEQAIRLKEAGITRIHCNIETAPSYFPEVCSTHSMEDKEVIIRTAEDHVLHLGTAELAAVLLAHDPAYGVGDVGLAGPVGSHDGGDVLAEIQYRLVGEALKPLYLKCF